MSTMLSLLSGCSTPQAIECVQPLRAAVVEGEVVDITRSKLLYHRPGGDISDVLDYSYIHIKDRRGKPYILLRMRSSSLRLGAYRRFYYRAFPLRKLAERELVGLLSDHLYTADEGVLYADGLLLYEEQQ